MVPFVTSRSLKHEVKMLSGCTLILRLKTKARAEGRLGGSQTWDENIRAGSNPGQGTGEVSIRPLSHFLQA